MNWETYSFVYGPGELDPDCALCYDNRVRELDACISGGADKDREDQKYNLRVMSHVFGSTGTDH